MKQILIVVLLFVLNACGSNGTNTYATQREGVEQLAQQEIQWRSNQISSYILKYYTLCFCSIDYKQVTVVDDEIVKVEIISHEGELLEEVLPQEYAQYYTIDDFFNKIQELDREVDVLSVAYDGNLSYPNMIQVDPYREHCDANGNCSGVVDDEYTYYIELVEKL